MNQPVWAEIQRKGAIASYVLPLIVGVISPPVSPGDEHRLHAELVVGTGFLVAGGRGLGITARHVVKQLLAEAPIPDLWTTVSGDNVRVPLAGFIDDSGDYRSSPIMAVNLHPTEDVALFRVPDQDLYSPYTFSAAEYHGSAEYAVWGYPEEVRHDYFTEGQRFLNMPLIYSGGYIRRRLAAEIPPPGPLGRSFYELTTPAGQCCSGAPVSIRRDPWRAIGVYVGERRQPERRLSDNEVVIGSAVGYATRADALVHQWPQLFDAAADLSELCPLLPQPAPPPQ
jgi:Trypsin-like peptidase domain